MKNIPPAVERYERMILSAMRSIDKIEAMITRRDKIKEFCKINPTKVDEAAKKCGIAKRELSLAIRLLLESGN